MDWFKKFEQITNEASKNASQHRKELGLHVPQHKVRTGLGVEKYPRVYSPIKAITSPTNPPIIGVYLFPMIVDYYRELNSEDLITKSTKEINGIGKWVYKTREESREINEIIKIIASQGNQNNKIPPFVKRGVKDLVSILEGEESENFTNFLSSTLAYVLDGIDFLKAPLIKEYLLHRSEKIYKPLTFFDELSKSKSPSELIDNHKKYEKVIDEHLRTLANVFDDNVLINGFIAHEARALVIQNSCQHKGNVNVNEVHESIKELYDSYYENIILPGAIGRMHEEGLVGGILKVATITRAINGGPELMKRMFNDYRLLWDINTQKNLYPGIEKSEKFQKIKELHERMQGIISQIEELKKEYMRKAEAAVNAVRNAITDDPTRLIKTNEAHTFEEFLQLCEA